MPTQYVAVQFSPWDRRSYTYENDGEAVTVGDRIIVPSPQGEKTVTVVGISPVMPSFPCKAIIGRAPAL